MGCLGKVRLYVFPFYVGKRAKHGDGFLFLQCPAPLEDFFFDTDVTRYGEPQKRAVVASYVTPKEFDDELVAADFELALARRGVLEAVSQADEKSGGAVQVPLRLRLRVRHEDRARRARLCGLMCRL